MPKYKHIFKRPDDVINWSGIQVNQGNIDQYYDQIVTIAPSIKDHFVEEVEDEERTPKEED